MALIDIDEFKSTMGIGNIYSNTIVQGVLDAASNIILGLLTFKQAAIIAAKYDDASNTATYYCLGKQPFDVGDSVTISTYEGAPFTGSQTVTLAGWDYSQTDKNHSGDHALVNFRPFGSGILASQASLYDTTPEIREAAMCVAIDIWQTRMGQSGQTGVDFQPAPYKLGRSLFGRVMGLIGGNLAVDGMVG